jgi:hypothetical protein
MISEAVAESESDRPAVQYRSSRTALLPGELCDRARAGLTRSPARLFSSLWSCARGPRNHKTGRPCDPAPPGRRRDPLIFAPRAAVDAK